MEAIPADKAFSTSTGENSSVMVTCTLIVVVVTTCTSSSTLSLFHPNWVTMNAGVLLSLTTRCRE